MDSQHVDSSDDAAGHDLNVLHIADSAVFDRFGTMLRQLILAQHVAGVRVALLTDDEQAVRRLETMPVECRSVPHLAGWFAPRHFVRQIEDFEAAPNVLHVWGQAGLRHAANWAREAGIPVMAYLLGEQDVAAVVALHGHLELRIVVACRELAAALGPQRRATARELAPALLPPEQATTARAERTMGVLWTGHFQPRAGLDVLIDAVATVNRQDCDLQVVLIGAGRLSQELRERIRAAHIQDCITVIDEPELWERALAGADVYVMPAREGELSLAPLQAMATGRLVIASRDQIADWFIEDQTAWQFSPGSAVELAYQLSRAARNDRQAEQLRASAARYVQAHHGIVRLANELLEMYTQVVTRP